MSPRALDRSKNIVDFPLRRPVGDDQALQSAGTGVLDRSMQERSPLDAEERDGRVTLNDIAARAQVSRATVSLVLRSSPLVATETRARVQAAMVALGYVYNRHAANLRSGSSRTIGFVVC